MQVRYRNQEGDHTRTMLPSGRYVVDSHGTIRTVQPALSKKERAKLKRKAKHKSNVIAPNRQATITLELR